MQHISDEELERYAMLTPPEPEAERLEEHLLVCAECRGRLQSMDEYLTAMRAAAERIGREEALS